MKKGLLPYDEVTDALLVDWRKNKRKVEVIAVDLSDDDEIIDDEIIDDEDDANKAHFVVCAPSRKLMHAVTAKAKESTLGAERMLLKNCILAGDNELLEDDSVRGSVLEAISELMETRKRTIVKR